MSRTTVPLTALGVCPPLEKLASLLTQREPLGLASEALTILLSDFGATAGSLFYATRPPVWVRRGDLSETLLTHIEHWEASIKARMAAGRWELASPLLASLAWQPVKGSKHVAAHSLILEGNRVLGTICLIFAQERLPAGSERDLVGRCLQAVGSMVSLVGELALTKQRVSQLSLFYQVAQTMASTFDLVTILDDTLELAAAVLDAGAAALLVVDEKEGDLVLEYSHGELGHRSRAQRVALHEGLVGWVAAHGEALVVNDAERDPRFDPAVDTWTGLPMQSVVCAPIQIRGKCVGVLEVLNKRSATGFDLEDLSLLITTANQAAIAIENHQLYQGMRDEQERILRAQEHVRRQVARNLHDGTVQFLSAISMGIDHLERLLEFKPEAARSELQALRDLTHQATQQARLALFELRPLILETQGLLPALEAYVQQLQDSEEFNVHLQADAAPPHLNSSVAATVFAIVQEAVTNAKKHATPQDVWLQLSQEDGWLQVSIEDNGKGFDSQAVEQNYDQKGSIGLLSMRERADLIDGHVEIQTSTTPPQVGTKVILRVPLPPEEDWAATQKTK